MRKAIRKTAAALAASAPARRRKARAAWVAAAAGAIALAPAQAFAADGGNAITNFFTTIKTSMMEPVYYGILGLIAVAAAIAFVVLIVRGFADPRGEQRSKWLFGIVVVLVIVLVAAFLPTLINWVIGLQSNSGMTTLS